MRTGGRGRFLLPVCKQYPAQCFRLAANAIPGPASRRTANGAAAERRGRLFLPPAAAALSAPLSFFSVLARKERQRRARCKKEKGACTRVSRRQTLSRSPRISGVFPKPGAIVEKAVAPVSARRRFAWRCMVQAVTEHAPSSRRSPGNPTGARRPPLAVSIREVLRRGRKRNLPLLSVPSFAAFLRTSEEKLIAQLAACIPVIGWRAADSLPLHSRPYEGK